MSPTSFRQQFRRESRQGTFVMHFATSGAEALDRLEEEIEPTLVAVLSDINYGTLPHPLAVRHRPQFELLLPGPVSRCEARRTRARRALRARRLGAERG